MATDRQTTLTLRVAVKGSEAINRLFAPAKNGVGGGMGGGKNLQAIGQDIGRAYDAVAKLNAAMDPQVLLATAKAQLELKDAQTAYAKSLKEVQDALRPSNPYTHTDDAFVGPKSSQQLGLDEFQVRADRSAQAVAVLNRAMDPDLIQKTARAQNELAKTQKDYDTALARAKGNQLGFFGGLGQGFTSGGPVTNGGIGQAAGAALAGGGGIRGALGAGLAAAGPLGMVGGQALNMAVGGVAKGNPIVAERLDHAFNDLSAVLGRALTPAFVAFTDIVRLAADLLVPVVNPLAQAFAYLLLPVRVFTALLSEAFGVQGKSVGAAVGSASFGGLAERGANASREALSAGSGAEGHLASINGMVGEILAWLRTPARYQVAKTVTELNPAWWLGTKIGEAIAH